MTVHIGDHIEPVGLPGADWTVDAVVDMHLDHDMIQAHDSDGVSHNLAADEAVIIGGVQ